MAEQVTLRYTPNQLVAYNLWRARMLRGWTQEQVAARLEPFLGERWSKASYSVAESSWRGGRQRRFSAAEIMACAQTFHVPIAWFFLPILPSPDGSGYEAMIPVVSRTGRAKKAGRSGEQQPWELPPGRLIDLLFGGDVEAFMERLAATAAAVPAEFRGEVQKVWNEFYARTFGAIAGEELGPFKEWAETLRKLAGALDRVTAETPQEVMRNLEQKEASSVLVNSEDFVLTITGLEELDKPVKAPRKRSRQATRKGAK